jgi:hypothetical protein
LIIFVVLVYYVCKRKKAQDPNIFFEHMINNNNNNEIVVLFKTHTWNKEIEKFVIKLKNETQPNQIDFVILMHSNDYTLPNKITDSELKKHVLTFDEDAIKKIYPNGFFGMWLSNHWILMWFYQQFKNKYQFYWSIEYDVRISGNSTKIWTHNGSEDFIYPYTPFQNLNWTWKDYCVSNRLTDDNKWYGYLQLARYSKKFLEYLDKNYAAGENGQDELITFSLFKRGETEIGLSGDNSLLYSLIKNSWSVDNADSDKHKKILTDSEEHSETEKDHLIILHPVKY